jgi:levanase/fructan beta-fructosidase
VGPNFYATQTWGNTEAVGGRRIQIAWMRDGKYPDMPFNQQMTFPCELTLRELGGSPHLFRKPIREVDKLHRQVHTWKDRSLSAGETLPVKVAGDLFHLLAEVEIRDGSALMFTLRGMAVRVTAQSLACAGRTAPLSSRVKTVEILVDRTSVEAFANEGEASISACFLPKEDGLRVECTEGTAAIRALQVFELQSTWKK